MNKLNIVNATRSQQNQMLDQEFTHKKLVERPVSPFRLIICKKQLIARNRCDRRLLTNSYLKKRHKIYSKTIVKKHAILIQRLIAIKTRWWCFCERRTCSFRKLAHMINYGKWFNSQGIKLAQKLHDLKPIYRK